MVFINAFDRLRNTLIYGDSEDGSVYIMDTQSKKLIKNHVRHNHLQYGLTCAVVSDHSLFWVGFQDGAVLQFDKSGLLEGKLSKIRLKNACPVFAISTYDHMLCFANGTLISPTNEYDERNVRLPVTSDITSACFVSDSLLLTGFDDGQLILWDYINLLKKHCFSGHVSRVERIMPTEDVNAVISYGRDDLHVGIWYVKSEIREISLATESGAVQHMDTYGDQLVLLCKQQSIVIFHKINTDMPEMKQRIQLHHSFIAVFILNEIYVVDGSANSMQIHALNELDFAKKRRKQVSSHKSLEETIDVYSPLSSTTHKVCLSVALDSVIADNQGNDRSGKHVNIFHGALRAGDCKLIDSLLVDRTDAEIIEYLQPLPDSLRRTLVQHLCRHLVTNTETTTQIIPWLKQIIELFPIEITSELIRLFDYRCSVFNYLVRLRNLMNFIPEKQIIRTNSEPRKNLSYIPTFIADI
ncbi:hypothetical protein GJ496_011950 [Pomphorhynchus laevis]|nr:hypothetical protein GJ496_011950 [Pomphorhynchus laevis]